MKYKYVYASVGIVSFVFSVCFVLYSLWVNAKYELVPAAGIMTILTYGMIFCLGCFILYIPPENLWYEEASDEKVVRKNRFILLVSTIFLFLLDFWSIWDMFIGINRKEGTLWAKLTSGGVVDFIKFGWINRLVELKTVDVITPITMFIACFLLSVAIVFTFLFNLVDAMDREGVFQRDFSSDI